MKKLIASLFLVLAIAAPVFAQDETPTADVATPVVTETVAPEPTIVVEPTEVPAPVEPAPIDEAAIPAWVFTIIVVLAVGVVSVAIVGIIQASKSWPPAAREILLSVLNTGVGELDKVAAGTETEIDNAAVAELRKRLSQLEQELRATQVQVNVVEQKVG